MKNLDSASVLREDADFVHTPVLLAECLEFLFPDNSDGLAVMVDATMGEAGHSYAFLSKFPSLQIIGVDADAVIQERAKIRLSEFSGRVNFYSGFFNDFFAEYPEAFPKPDLILFDLGISLFHYEKSGRGFSFRYDEPLDMRLSASSEMTAADIVNDMREEQLADLIYNYGGEKMSRRIARAITEARVGGRITSSRELADIIYDAVSAAYKHGAIHPATRTFQALRIAVNGELHRLPVALHDAFSVLNVGGKLGVITFHSLEDKIVKNYFRGLGKNCVCPANVAVCKCGGTPCAEILTRKPIAPTAEECEKNPPSRSAKLRVVRKLRNPTEMHKVMEI